MKKLHFSNFNHAKCGTEQVNANYQWLWSVVYRCSISKRFTRFKEIISLQLQITATAVSILNLKSRPLEHWLHTINLTTRWSSAIYIWAKIWPEQRKTCTEVTILHKWKEKQKGFVFLGVSEIIELCWISWNLVERWTKVRTLNFDVNLGYSLSNCETVLWP